MRSKTEEQAKKLSNFSQVYSSKLDSLGTSLKFLENTNLVNPELKDKLQQSLGTINSLQNKLNQTDQIRKYLKERKKLLTEQLEKLGMVKELKQFNKQVFYYQQQIKEYKEILDNPEKLGAKLLEVMVKLPAFRDFFSRHSMLASLFRLPGSPGSNDPASLAGLQTRAFVMQDLQNRFGSGQAVQQMMQQNVQQAQDQLNQLRNQVTQRLGSGSSDDEIPSFRPNNQKTKNFWQRIELGTNFQNQRNNGLLPVTSDIGLSVGYKLNDKSIIGIGGSYKLGWGENIQNIRFSHQGAGARSFIDWRLKGSFWISGGYEINYRPALQGVQLPSPLRGERSGVRSQSGLIGLSKVVSMNSKLFKKTKVQLLWDFLASEQAPRGQPIIFRIGYSFK